MKLQCWPLKGKDQHSIKAIEEVVDTKYHDAMTSDQEDAFKVAFVVFVMSTLFVPGARHDYAHVDYWGALSNPNGILEFDWSAYIHKRLIIAAAKYKTGIETSSGATNITGCDLFLQVFYLDNMDIPKWGMDHSVQPRISCFTYERIRSMIAAGTHDRHDAQSSCVYGKTTVRPRGDSCYTWAQTSMDHPMDADGKADASLADASLWKAVVSMIAILRVPLEAAGPVYMAAAELNHGSQSIIECIAILLRMVEPFIKGFSFNFDLHPYPDDFHSMDGDLEIPENLCHYCASTEHTGVNGGSKCKKRTNGVDGSTPASGSMVVRSIGDVGCAENVAGKRIRSTPCSVVEEIVSKTIQTEPGAIDCSVFKLMTRFYMLLSCVRQRNRLDLNAACTENEKWQSVGSTEEVRMVGAAKSPWELGGVWDYNSLDRHAPPGGMEVLPNSTDGSLCTMPRIVDYTPKYVELMPGAALEQRMGISEMEMDMFDAIIRCFKQSDDKLYSAEGRLRWRHYFESDILAAVIAGCFDIDNPCMWNQFIVMHLTYDIYNCNMLTQLFFPVILHERWICFSWNLKDNEIVVFDPACMNIPGFSRRSLYKRVAEMLKSTLSSIIPVLIPVGIMIGTQHLYCRSIGAMRVCPGRTVQVYCVHISAGALMAGDYCRTWNRGML